ncbi:ABC transporter C family member 8 [Ananas comosus]|uniref:ABC transporter C family member 8 n=1 Tax=Ananas comosus TaxID=4615 RepID=A0A199W3T7_ANACO|nr:ABC transporter C family member 8 [Ananas comosus]
MATLLAQSLLLSVSSSSPSSSSYSFRRRCRAVLHASLSNLSPKGNKPPIAICLMEVDDCRRGITPAGFTPLLPAKSLQAKIDDAVIRKLYAIAEAAADRAEMHAIIGKQRDNWNHLFLHSVNSLALSASLMSGLACVGSDASSPHILAFKLSSVLLFAATSTVMLVVNKVQPSQLAEEQRNAARLWRKLEKEIQSKLSLQTPRESDVDAAMRKVLALDKATFCRTGWFHMMICGREFNLGSPCTQRTLIDIINIFFLVAYILGLLSTSFRKNYANGNRNRRWYSIIVSLCCALISIAYIILGIWDLSNGKQNISNLVVYFVRGIVWIALTISMHIHPTKLVKLIAFIWWVSLALLISAYNLEVLLNVRRTEILELMSWPVNILLLFNALSCIFRSSDPSCDSLSQPLLTNNDADILMAEPLLKLGYSKPLDLDDIPTLDSEDGAFDASQKFLQVWTIQKQEKSRSRNSIFLVLGKCYSKDILLTGFYALVKTISIAAAPILLYFFVWYSHKEERDLYMGFFYEACESLSQRHWFFESRRVGMRMRSALMAAVFQKQLKLSSQEGGIILQEKLLIILQLTRTGLGFSVLGSHGVEPTASAHSFYSHSILDCGFGCSPGLVPLIICGFLNVPFAKILQGYNRSSWSRKMKD